MEKHIDYGTTHAAVLGGGEVVIQNATGQIRVSESMFLDLAEKLKGAEIEDGKFLKGAVVEHKASGQRAVVMGEITVCTKHDLGIQGYSDPGGCTVEPTGYYLASVGIDAEGGEIKTKIYPDRWRVV